MKGCIYKIASKSNCDRIYIGSAVNFQLRKDTHKYHLRKGTHANIILQRHVNKYGIEDLDFSIVEPVNDNTKLLEREQYYIDNLVPIFNICKTAGNTLGRKFTEETKEKIRLKAIGRLTSKETKEKISISLIGNSRKLGKKVSVDTKDKMSKAHKGNKVNLGRKQSIEHIESRRSKIIGRKHTEESKEKMRIARRRTIELKNGKND